MKATIDVPDDLEQVVSDIAHDLRCSIDEAILWLMRRGVGERLAHPEIGVNELTGFPTIRTGRLITASEVERFLDEDE